jgi:Flp pilus assembly protein TadD
VIATLVACGVVVAASVLAIRARPDEPRRRLFFVGVAWACLTLGPVAVTGPNLEMVGDRYAYLPLVGVFLALAALLDAALSTSGRRAVVAAFVAAPVLFAWTLRSRGRLAEWRDERTLFSASVRDDPANFYSVYSLGSLDAVEGRFAEAEPALVRADELRPGYWRTENALCFVWLNTGHYAKAERACLSSARHMPDNPRVWINLMTVYVRASQWPRCLEAAPSAIALRPRGAEPVYLRAVCKANLGDLPGAAADVRAALGFDASHAGANDLARQLRARGAM